MNVISVQNFFANFDFQGPCYLRNDTISKVYRMRLLLKTILKPENAATCLLDSDEKSDFIKFYRDINIGLKAIEMLGKSGVFYDPMTATWKVLNEEIDEYFDVYDGLKAAYQALYDAEARFMEEAF